MKKTPKVSLLIETSREYGRGLLRGIARYSALWGGWSMERETPFYLRKSSDESVFEDPQRWLADGIIMREPASVEEVQARGIPVVFASYLKQEVHAEYCIDADDEAIGQMGAEHFIERGFNSFAYIGLAEMFWSDARQRAFEGYIKPRGYKCSSLKIAVDSPAPRSMDELLEIADWLGRLKKPVGVMACNDDIGAKVIAACQLGDLRVPEDVAVLGVDNDEFICGLTNPAMSSIHLDLERAGFEAASLLDRIMRGEKPSPTAIKVQPLRVEVRQSTDMLAIEDEAVARAVRFIRENVRQPLQVDDVVEASGLGRRALYTRFKAVLGRTIQQEIRRMRNKDIARLLIETDLPIYRIASEMGFADAAHIAQYFRGQMGSTPTEYRAEHAAD